MALKKRFIGFGIRTVVDCIDFLNRENQEGLLAFIDFEKAFDKLNWDFIDKMLYEFNFGENVRKWIKTIYNKIESCTINNGFTSKYFKILNGVRQGDPLSSLLFIIAVEVLAIAIRQNNNIEGIKVNNYEVKISLLADDTTLMIRNILSLRNALNVLSLFYFASGLKINYEKTVIMQIGKITTSFLNIKPFNLQWSTGGVKSLGIKYYNDINEITKINLNEKLLEFTCI